MDLTTLGTLLVGVGAVAAAVVTYLGKRGENRTTSWVAEIDQVQEERDGLRSQVVVKDARIAELLEARLTDQVEIARLRVKVVELGGDPS
ncbi:hypothetical protein PYK79_31725 [Streptomyces sp. ID05-04B]|uniref:hypothetical protein n=1 Tax=Streptomyces sp. ID05-04B TaxID=3028661 RepID=UPI0029C4D4E3|nr:hypothetical protein [Streptomyces sp. ID05-04B]MDX5566903.1 hypothetical protein [Streptomyces sp. ID05-04B]